MENVSHWFFHMRGMKLVVKKTLSITTQESSISISLTTEIKEFLPSTNQTFLLMKKKVPDVNAIENI